MGRLPQPRDERLDRAYIETLGFPILIHQAPIPRKLIFTIDF
jgi:hypothetical protein